ncbi:HAMP domain-containing sensor histidine kinase [Microbacterium sp.]|uniref:sensor histidine kinase n=1 Tax=Microbacterium sp. TaxID=51671 RepID=UPI00281280FA|nr:HAMP domain-containing sensor histidine kinase [Microbacterium sp.]
MTDTGRAPRRHRLPVSVRTRLVAAITAVAALGLMAVGVSVYIVERQTSLDQVNARLLDNLESARFIVAEGEAMGAETTDPSPWPSSSAALRAVVERMSPDDNTGAAGMIDGAISMVPGVRLDVDLSDATAFASYVHEELSGDEPIIGTYAERGVTWRYLAAPILVEGSPAPKDVVFLMVYDLDAELAEFDATAQIFLLASMIALAVIAATSTIVATRLLRPLRHMRETANRVSGHSLQERIPVVGNDDVADLARTMNAMLDRLDDALDSQRQLLSDVGHELKTPITIVRGHLEVMDPADPEDARDTRALAVDELDRMGQLVQDLAGAAALHGPRPVQLAPVDVSDLLQQIGRKAEGIVGADVVLASTPDGVAALDAPRITQAMLQLAQNAITHGGGRLEIGGSSDADHIELWVRDFGAGVPDDEKDSIFDRFHRGAGAPVRGSSGLGLNIVQVIARAHGGSVRVTDADDGGAVFTLRVPRGSAPAARLPNGVLIPPRPPLPTVRRDLS